MKTRIKTTAIITPDGKDKIILRTKLSQEECEKILDELKALSKQPQILLWKMIENLIIEKYLINVNGKEEKPIELLLNLRESDFDFVLEKIKEKFKSDILNLEFFYNLSANIVEA